MTETGLQAPASLHWPLMTDVRSALHDTGPQDTSFATGAQPEPLIPGALTC